MNGPAASPFPWRAVMALGLGRLAWPPDTFWSATPCEILAAAGAFGAGEAVADRIAGGEIDVVKAADLLENLAWRGLAGRKRSDPSG